MEIVSLSEGCVASGPDRRVPRAAYVRGIADDPAGSGGASESAGRGYIGPASVAWPRTSPTPLAAVHFETLEIAQSLAAS